MGTTSFFNQTTIMKELLQGQEFASQLHHLLSKNGDDDDQHQLQYFSPTTTELLCKISRSFTHAISALSATNGSENNPNQAVSHGEQQSSAGSGGPLFEDSGESRKRPAAAGKSGAAGRDNRGSYKRRKNGHSRVIVSSLTQDGHAWRKYGQKEILHAKFPRSYFRCTHKYEQGCKATKQVQQLEQEKEMYSITYLGHHTCNNATRAAALPPPSPVVVATDSNENEPSQTVVDVKQEVSNNNEESTPSAVTTENDDGNANMWEDLVSFGLEAAEEAVNNYGYGFGNYSYCGRDGAASNSEILDMDFSVKDIDFDDGFRFDPEERCGLF